MNTFIVYSSHGSITADAITGKVITIDRFDESDNEDFMKIKRFHVKEYKKEYKTEEIPERGVDILDIGYWWQSNAQNAGAAMGALPYEQPCYDWREECKEMRLNPDGFHVFR